MADLLTAEQRRLNMSRIKGRDTRPEKRLRSALHAAGLRFRIHRRDLPGRPDIVFVKARLVIFVDGCFWHGCPDHGARPKTNAEFWDRKIAQNKKRDTEVLQQLSLAGWLVLRFWEHQVERELQKVMDEVLSALDDAGLQKMQAH